MTKDEIRMTKQMPCESKRLRLPGICFVIRHSNFVIDSVIRISSSLRISRYAAATPKAPNRFPPPDAFIAFRLTGSNLLSMAHDHGGAAPAHVAVQG